MRILKYLVIFLIAVTLIYASAWFVVLRSISKDINDKYAGQKLSTKALGAGEEAFIKFSNISPTGFPFQFAFKIIGFIEDNNSSTLECLSPIITGYDLLAQSLFATYTGDAIARYKPIQSGFGSKIMSDDYSLFIKLPLTIDLIQMLRSDKNAFALINFINGIQLQSKKITATDLVDNSSLYDQDFELVKLYFNNRKYYTDLDDFLSNVPKRLDVHYSIKTNQTSLSRRPAPASILFGILSPFLGSAEVNFYAKTNESNFKDISKDLEIGLTDTKASDDFNSLTANILYKGSITDKSMNFDLHTDINSELKEGFIDKYSNILKQISPYLAIIQAPWGLRNYIDYIANNREQLKFINSLEKRKYNINLDLNVNGATGKTLILLKNFNITSGKTGIYIKNNTEFTNFMKWNSKGDILLNNHTKLVDVMSDFYKIGEYKSFSDEKRKLYVESNKLFLKAISDHPNSTSNDISFQTDLDSAKIMTGRIGSTEIGKIPALYYLNLYKNTGVGLIHEDDINLRNKVKELTPILDGSLEMLK